MILVVDIGNTNIVLGIFSESPENNKTAGVKQSARFETRQKYSTQEITERIRSFITRDKINPQLVKKIVISSVVPSLIPVFTKAVKAIFDREPIIVSHRIKLPLTIDIDNPNQLGADRIANAVAGYSLYGGPVIVVDIGTAITFDVVTAEGVFIGGIIIPGPKTAITGLASHTAQLFEVPFEQPGSVVGKSTKAALKSGLFYGTIGQIDYIIERILDEHNFTDCSIIATGGLAFGMETYSRYIQQVSPALTLEGLRIIGEMN